MRQNESKRKYRSRKHHPRLYLHRCLAVILASYLCYIFIIHDLISSRNSKSFRFSRIEKLMFMPPEVQNSKWHESVNSDKSLASSEELFSWDDLDEYKSDLWNQLWNTTTGVYADTNGEILTPGARELHEGRVILEFLPRILDRRQMEADVLILSFMDDIEEDVLAKQIMAEALSYRQNPFLLDHSRALNTLKANYTNNVNNDEMSPKPLLFFVTTSHKDNHPNYSTNVDSFFSHESCMEFLSSTSPEYIVLSVSVKRASQNRIYSHGQLAVQALLNADYKVQLLASTHFVGPSWTPNKLFFTYNINEFFVSAGSLLNIGQQFQAFIFATRGFDLALPSRRPYLDLNKVCMFDDSTNHDRCGRYYRENDDIFTNCNVSHTSKYWISVDFSKENRNNISLVLNGKEIQIETKESEKLNLHSWISNANEAACVVIFPENFPITSCSTQIITKRLVQTKPKLRPSLPNILWISLDSMSKDQVKQLIQNFSFGHSLSDVNVLNSLSSYSKDQFEYSTLFKLNREGYATFSGSNECKGKEIRKNPAMHGSSSLNHMFCRYFERPNCVGGKSTADHLFTNAYQFVKGYSREDRPWATFLNLADMKDDSLTLFHNLRSKLPNMAQKVIDYANENTIVVVASNGGIGYGPFYRSHLGASESAQPSLYVSSHYLSNENNTVISSLGDVYDFVINQIPLLPTRPKTDLISNQSSDDEICSTLKNPPSVYSFYADISRNRRPRWPKCDGVRTKILIDKKGNLKDECLCSTDEIGWHRCGQHPFVNHTANRSTAALILCHESFREITLDIRVKKETSDLKARFREKPTAKIESINGLNDENNGTQFKHEFERQQRPDILIIEVDSVSVAYAERHFPLTNQVLKEHRIQHHENENFSCLHGFCSVTFDKGSVVGANSIPNQIAELSGCIYEKNSTESLVKCFRNTEENDNKTKGDDCVTKGQYFGKVSGTCRPCPLEYVLQNPTRQCYSDAYRNGREVCCTKSRINITENATCLSESSPKKGLQLYKRVKNGDLLWCPFNYKEQEKFKRNIDSPWIFDIVKELGYVTFFGEEFCYEDSPYVVQDLFFKTEPDYRIDKIYCRLAMYFKRAFKLDPNHPMWAVDHDRASDAKPCIDGRSRHQISHEYLIKIWENRVDKPKFAYLNAIAAHDYGLLDEYLNLGAEAYDELLSIFLKTIFSSPFFKHTIIVLRSDHGLQGGPAAIDYSTQQEHAHTWSHVLFHESFSDFSINALETNQNRLVTGYDLYKTLIGLVNGSSSSSGQYPVPTWSYDLFKEIVPLNRTCDEAKIPPEYCLCINKRTPSFIRPRFNLTSS